MEHRHNVSVIAKPCLRPGCPRRGTYRRGLCGGCYSDAGLRLLHAAPDLRPVPAGKCGHCRRRRANRPRGLCFGCYYSPGVKDLYLPSVAPSARRSEVGGNTVSRVLPEPTAALPGTPEKLLVLESRAAAEQLLWHPGDAVRLPVEGWGDSRNAGFVWPRAPRVRFVS